MENVANKTVEEMELELFKAQANILAKGGTFADALEIDLDKLETLYGLAYNHYTAGNYEDAMVLFQALSLYNHNDPRFWMGLAGARQATGDLNGAVDAYSMAAMVEGMRNPEPIVFGAICYMKLGDSENAKAALEGALTLGSDDPKHVAARQKAELLLDAINGVQA